MMNEKQKEFEEAKFDYEDFSKSYQDKLNEKNLLFWMKKTK